MEPDYRVIISGDRNWNNPNLEAKLGMALFTNA